jgi:hypothetical protein
VNRHVEGESIMGVQLTMNRGEPFLNLFYHVMLKLYGIIVAFETIQKYFLTILASCFHENMQTQCYVTTHDYLDLFEHTHKSRIHSKY